MLNRFATSSGWLAVAAAGVALWLGACTTTIPHRGDDLHPAALNSASVSIDDSHAVSAASARTEESWTATRTPWRFADYDGWHVRTPNYDIFTTIEHDVVLDRLPNFYEAALHNYTTAFCPLPIPTRRFESYMFQDRRQWAAKTRQMLPAQSELFLRLGRGGFTTRGIAILYYIDYGPFPRDTFAIASHEGWHQYTQQTFRHQLPIWLEEGIATYMEGYRISREGVPTFQPHHNRERERTLREAVRRDRLIPLSELLRRTPQSFLERSKDHLLVYYAQVWGLVRFLYEGADGRYRDGLNELLRDAAEGRFVGRLLESNIVDRRSARNGSIPGRIGAAPLLVYFNSDMSEFEREYLAFVAQIVGIDRDSDPVSRRRTSLDPAPRDEYAIAAAAVAGQ